MNKLIKVRRPNRVLARAVLPYPPSVNRIWRSSGNHTYKTLEARDFEQQVKWSLIGLPPTSRPVALFIDIYRPRKSGDIDNRLKSVLDALQGVLYYDDNQVIEIHAKRHDDKSAPRVELTAEWR